MKHESLGKGCSRYKTDRLGVSGYRPARLPRGCKYCHKTVTDNRAPWHQSCREKTLAAKQYLRANSIKVKDMIIKTRIDLIFRTLMYGK